MAASLDAAPVQVQLDLPTLERTKTQSWAAGAQEYIEGLVIKALGARYGAAGSWVKIRHSDTEDAQLIGALGEARCVLAGRAWRGCRQSQRYWAGCGRRARFASGAGATVAALAVVWTGRASDRLALHDAQRRGCASDQARPARCHRGTTWPASIGLRVRQVGGRYNR